jgi:hypothetical protein
MTDNELILQHLQNLIFLQQGGNRDNTKNSSGFQQQAPQQSLAEFANNGLVQQFLNQQNQQNNIMCLPQAPLSNETARYPNQFLSGQRQHSMNQVPCGGFINPYLQQSSYQPPNPAPATLSSASLETVSVNSFGSISMGSLSRLFSIGTIGSGGNIANKNMPMPGTRVSNDFQRQAQTNAGTQNETWSAITPRETDSFADNGMLGPWSAASAALLGDLAISNEEKQKKNRKKPKDRPKRPLSAYNIFFKEERARILEEVTQSPMPNGKIGFQNLAKMIGKRWHELDSDSMKSYKKKAETDMVRYKEEMLTYTATQQHSRLSEC